MEPEVKAFLLRIINSLSMVLLWMMLNMTAGIFYGLAFFEESPSVANILYWCFCLISFVALLAYLRNKWKDFKEISEE
jgi:hypothetical protein